MYRGSSRCCFHMPRNLSVAPRLDIWREKFQPHGVLRNMGKIVGTGFYIPPEWYNHFRMFPPITDNFLPEQTKTPFDDSEPTAQQFQMSEERKRLREALAKSSRGLASEGMRYYNIFWVSKALDEAERNYLNYKRQGCTNEEAFRKTLGEYYNKQTVKKRISIIQKEEAKLSGKFITMREASTLLNVLAQIQDLQLAPHQLAELTGRVDQQVRAAPLKHGRARRVPKAVAVAKAVAATPDGEGEKAESTAEKNIEAAEALAQILEEDGADGGETVVDVTVQETEGESFNRLKERATDSTGKGDWYRGHSPTSSPPQQT